MTDKYEVMENFGREIIGHRWISAIARLIGVTPSTLHSNVRNKNMPESRFKHLRLLIAMHKIKKINESFASINVLNDANAGLYQQHIKLIEHEISEALNG
jgi:hypothetical protein